MDFIEVSAKTYDEAVTEAQIQLGLPSDQLEIEVLEEGSKGFLGLGAKPCRIRVGRKFNVESYIRKFLGDIFQAMHMEVEVLVEINEEKRAIDVELKGQEMGVLIGKRGQTLDSVQYLTSLVVNKGNGPYVRVKVDTEDYRRRRKETLENLARNIASKVKRTRKPVFLEPMNPYERRIIHSALQNNPYVATHSEGEEPYRKVVVTLKNNNSSNRER